MVLDLKFFLEASGHFSTESTYDAINDAIDKSILLFCKKRGMEENFSVLKSDDWFGLQLSRYGKYTL